MIRHIVLLQFSDATPNGHLEAFREQMLALTDNLPEIKALEFGIDMLKDTRSWHVSLFMTFDSVEDMRTYQQHADHVAIAKFNEDYLVTLASVDYKVEA